MTQILTRIQQYQRAESSSHQKGREVCAVSGRVESFAGGYIRPSRAGCSTGAPTAILAQTQSPQNRDYLTQNQSPQHSD